MSITRRAVVRKNKFTRKFIRITVLLYISFVIYHMGKNRLENFRKFLTIVYPHGQSVPCQWGCLIFFFYPTWSSFVPFSPKTGPLYNGPNTLRRDRGTPEGTRRYVLCYLGINHSNISGTVIFVFLLDQYDLHNDRVVTCTWKNSSTYH